MDWGLTQCGTAIHHSKVSSSSEDSIPYLVKVDLDNDIQKLIQEGKVSKDYSITHGCCGWVHSIIVLDSKIVIGAGKFFQKINYFN